MAVGLFGRRDSDPPADALRVEPPKGQDRRPKLSWIAVGLLVAVVAALLGAVTVAQVADRQPVVALAQPIERGEVVTSDHLTVVEAAVDGEVSLVPAGERTELIGLVAAGPLEAGTLVTRSLFVDGPVVPAGWSVVGLALQPGEYPVASLRPGDRVVVVRTPDAVTTGAAAPEGAVVTDAAEVFAVEALSEASHSLMVSVAVPDAVASEVASAAAQGRARLVLRGES